ncbi:MAG: hypothetical protein ACR2P3_12935 [Geminicoccaceae bacterium]
MAEPVLRLPPPQSAEEAFEPVRPGFLRRLAANPRFSQYYRLGALVLIVNAAILAYGLVELGWWQAGGIDLTSISTMVVSNFALSILVRQQHVINILFWLATRPSTRWPRSVRWACGKVYHHGGLHSGGAVAGSLWFLIFAGSLSYHAINGLPGWSPTTLGLTYVLLALLSGIIIMALAPLRARYHDAFERMHRFGGWAALALFWVSTVTFTNDIRGERPLGDALLGSTGFWLLMIISVSILLPWLRLKRVPIEIVKPSDHAAVVRFNYGDTPFPGSSNAISRNPLLEWHSFANIPSPGEDGYRLIISRAGDWTGKFIDDTPSHVWVKGITTSGVARIEVLFKRVVYIATGSGIGPVMPHLLAKDVPIHLIWATRNPRKTYGDALVNEILEAVPDAVIWDTDAQGKPDLAKLAFEACRSFDAEAVICISNQKLTRRVVESMEQQGIPAFGAIWDS